MHGKLIRAGWMLVVLIGSTITLRSQEPNNGKEFWPEIDVYVPLNEKVRLFFLFTTTQSEETKSNLEGQFGAHVDYTLNSRFVLRAGYRYGFSIKEVHPVGLQIQLKKALPLLSLIDPRKQVILDINYTKQNDSRSQPNHIHAIGATLAIHF